MPFAECLAVRSSILQKASYMFGFELRSYSQRGYNLDENQFLNIYVIQSVYNALMYPAII
jgi:hypothetical protein